jgi:hypothetical protein
LIVSLTSFPDRIKAVSETIKSLLLQRFKPNRVILWLAKQQFPQKEGDLPDELLKLTQYGLEIKWCEDLRSYKKLIPTLQMFPEAIIVTADDDLYYRETWLKVLYQAYQKNKNVVWAHRITKFSVKDGEFFTIAGGYDTWGNASYLHKVTGCGGVLYPPHILHEDVLKKDVFMKICTTNDDIWFWLMAVLNEKKISVPSNAQRGLLYVKGTQEGPTLTSVNDHGENLFWKNFNSMLEYYPELDKRLREEYEFIKIKENMM